MSVAENNRRIAKNSLFLYVRMFIVMCIQLYTSRIILQTLGVVDFGIYGVVGGVVTMFTFLNGALASATSRYFTFELGKENFEKLRKIFSVSVQNHILMAVIIVLLSETIGLWFLHEKMEIPTGRMNAALWVFHLSVLTTLFSITQIPYTAAIIAHEKMGIYAYMGLLEAALKLAVAYAITVSPIDKLVFYAIVLFFIQILIMLFYRVYCTRLYKECRFKFYKDYPLCKEMLIYASYDLIGNVSVLAQGQGLNIVLNMFVGPVANAARAIAYQVQGAATQFSNNFMTAVRPQIIKYYAQGNTEDMMKLVRQGSIFCYALMLMIVLPLSLEAKYILTLWLGNYPDYTVSFTILVLINTLLNSFRSPRITVFHASGHIKLSNIVTGCILCMALPIGYFLMRAGYNPNSVFYGMLATTLIADISNLLILKKYVKYSIKQFLLQVHAKCLLLTLCVLLSVISVHSVLESGFIRLCATTVTSVFVTIILVWLFILPQNIREKIKSKLNLN